MEYNIIDEEIKEKLNYLEQQVHASMQYTQHLEEKFAQEPPICSPLSSIMSELYVNISLIEERPMYMKADIERAIIDNSNHSVDMSKLRYLFCLRSLVINPGSEIIESETIEELEIIDNYSFIKILDISRLPNLKKLIIRWASALRGVVASLSAVRHQLRMLTFIYCPLIDVHEMQNYCHCKNIELQII